MRCGRISALLVVVACAPPAGAPAPPPPRPPAAVAPPAAPVRAELAYLDGSLATLARKYIEPARFDPRRMLAGALDALELEVPEVVADVENDRVTLRVGERAQTFAGDVDSLAELGLRLTEIIHFVEAHARADVELVAVNGMLRTLDPHTYVMTADELRTAARDASGERAGIGVVVMLDGDTPAVVDVLPATPAARGGVARNDVIVAIDGVPTAGLGLEEASARLRGAPGSTVTLAIVRGTQRLEVVLERALIAVPIVSSRMLAGDIGYLHVDHFGTTAAAEVARAMAALPAAGGWVLDLRDNIGGLLQQAVATTDLFVDRGTIVATVAGGRKHDIKQATPGGDARTLVVLVGPHTASAAEIVAGALKQLDRAVVVGRRTFGKGSVQVHEDIARGAKLKVTIAEYVAANDISIQRVGITPDVELVPAEVPPAAARLRLEPAPPFRELDLGDQLATAQPLDRTRAIATVRYLAREGDVELQFAQQVAAAGEPSRAATLRRLPAVIDRVRREADAKLVAAFRRLGIDWSAGPGGEVTVAAPATLAATAGTLVTLQLDATNPARRAAHRVHARASSDDPVLDGLEIALGKIAPGATARGSTSVRLPRGTASRIARVRWQVGTRSATTQLVIRGQPAPANAKLVVEPVPLETRAATIRIAGTARGARDVYITTRAGSVTRKVFYTAGAAFSADVPLAPGANRIIVTAREPSSQTVQTIWVYRH